AGQVRPAASWAGKAELASAALEGAPRRLARLLEAAAGHVVQPAVVHAAQAAVLEPAVAEIGAAVRAVPREQPRAALLVAEQDEVLAQQAHRQRGAARRLLRRARHGLPVAAKQVAPGRAGAGLRDERVLFLAQHGCPRRRARTARPSTGGAGLPGGSARAGVTRRPAGRRWWSAL